MQEKWLHWAWEKQLIQGNKTIKIIDRGKSNPYKPGPDFLDACIEFEGLRWFGHVEMHINASDWYKHHHDLDPLYNNVILHVVTNNDRKVIIGLEPVKTLVVAEQLRNHLMGLYSNPKQSLICSSLLKSKTVMFSETNLNGFWKRRMLRKKNETSWEMAITQHLFLGLPLSNNLTLNKRQRSFNAILNSLHELQACKLPISVQSTNFVSNFNRIKEQLKKSKLTPFEQSNLILNGLIPFFYIPEKSNDFVNLAKEIRPENNGIIKLFKSIGIHCRNGYETQAILEIYRELCALKQCFNCELSAQVLKDEKKPTKIDFFL